VTRPDVTQSLVLGQFFQDRGQYEEALRELEEAKGRDPDNADILTALQRVRSSKEAEDKLNRSPWETKCGEMGATARSSPATCRDSRVSAPQPVHAHPRREVETPSLPHQWVNSNKGTQTLMEFTHPPVIKGISDFSELFTICVLLTSALARDIWVDLERDQFIQITTVFSSEFFQW
jgi:tetratricopeptide (TPR) repeat protein